MPKVLTSWKEIAAHLYRGVRTVQRWEKEFGLPIRRPDRSNRIVGDTDELDQWLKNTFQLRPSQQHYIGDQQILAKAEDGQRTTRNVIAEAHQLQHELRAEAAPKLQTKASKQRRAS